MRSARGWDNLSQSFAWGPRQSSSDRLRSRPINFASRTTSLCQLQICGIASATNRNSRCYDPCSRIPQFSGRFL
jgi:hypothetical protein